jgi:hypothetical protein
VGAAAAAEESEANLAGVRAVALVAAKVKPGMTAVKPEAMADGTLLQDRWRNYLCHQLLQWRPHIHRKHVAPPAVARLQACLQSRQIGQLLRLRLRIHQTHALPALARLQPWMRIHLPDIPMAA